MQAQPHCRRDDGQCQWAMAGHMLAQSQSPLANRATMPCRVTDGHNHFEVDPAQLFMKTS